jgi:hypothetical protein
VRPQQLKALIVVPAKGPVAGLLKGVLTPQTKEEMMPGIIDFLTDVGGDRDLSGQFVSLIASPDCTQQDLMDFFKANHYGDVTPADVGKIMTQRENIKTEFNVPQNVDY